MNIENNGFIQHTLAIFSRRKRLTAANALHSQLRRCLTVVDLTTLGIGSTLGAGIYILAGTVARDLAGPGVVLSFLIAGMASLLSGLCYAELGSKYPRAGSAYVYSYVVIGELAAFITGLVV
jgi:amino acid transporter